MLDYCRNVLDINPIAHKFKAFKWDTSEVDGHDLQALYQTFKDM